VELITAKVLRGMLLLRLAKLMGFPSLYVGITVSYREFLSVRLRHAGNKDYLNSRNGMAFCEFITELQEYHRRSDSHGPRRQHVLLILTTVHEAHSKLIAIIPREFVERNVSGIFFNVCATNGLKNSR
jgi:hypothetical protein